jgi:uncharacterized protein
MSRLLPGICVLVLAWSAVGAAQAPPSETGPPVIVAQGQSLIQRPADVAWVQIGVEARGMKQEEARQRAADAMTAVLGALKGIVPPETIKTSAYSVTPEMEYVSGLARLKGYVARNRVEVRVDDLDKLSKVMDASVSSGASSVSGLRFDMKARAELEREALRLAVQDAMGRAQAIAAGAGRTLGAIVRIQETRTSSPQNTTFMESVVGGQGGGGRGMATPAPVAPGDIDIRAMTVVTVSIK